MGHIVTPAFHAIDETRDVDDLRNYVVSYVRNILAAPEFTTPEKLDWVYQLFDAADQVASRRGWQL